MTCIIASITEDGAYMMGDRCISAEDEMSMSIGIPKVERVFDFLIGFTGHIYLWQILRSHIDPVVFDLSSTTCDFDSYMCEVVIPSIIRAYAKHGYVEYSSLSEGNLLLATKDRIVGLAEMTQYLPYHRCNTSAQNIMSVSMGRSETAGRVVDLLYETSGSIYQYNILESMKASMDIVSRSYPSEVGGPYDYISFTEEENRCLEKLTP